MPKVAGSASYTAQDAPRKDTRLPVRVVIPDIGMDRDLAHVGLDARNVPIVPKHDPAWYERSAVPGTGGNVVLWGHALRFRSTPDIPAPFGRLKELSVGAKITLYTSDGAAYTYVITQQIWATPDQAQYIWPKDHELLTMVSCIGDMVITKRGVEMTHRLITIAEPEKRN